MTNADWPRIRALFGDLVRPGDGCREPDPSLGHVARGGSFMSWAGLVRSAERVYRKTYAGHLGVRPSRDLAPWR